MGIQITVNNGLGLFHLRRPGGRRGDHAGVANTSQAPAPLASGGGAAGQQNSSAWLNGHTANRLSLAAVFLLFVGFAFQVSSSDDPAAQRQPAQELVLTGPAGRAPTALQRRALVLTQAGQFAAAAGLLERALTSASLSRWQRAELLNELAAVRCGEGRSRKALESLQKAVAADPSYLPARKNLAVVLQSQWQ